MLCMDFIQVIAIALIAAGFIPGDSKDVNYCRVVNNTDAAICKDFLH